MTEHFSEEYIEEIRKNFPTIASDFKGVNRIFLDNGAGSLVLKNAADAEYNARILYSANTDAIYNESKMTEETLKTGRKAISYLLNIKDSKRIFESESASSNLFKVSYALRNHIHTGDNVVSTSAEHFANVAPYLEMKKNGKIDGLRLAKLNRADGTVDMDDFASLVDSKTKVIAVTAESNLLGNKTKLKEIAKIARENEALLVIDGVHYTPQAYFDASSVDCDIFVFSAYKIFGPRGSFAYISERALDVMDPFYVDREAKTGKPSYFELGTKDQAIFAAMSSVVEYISRLSLSLEDFSNGAETEIGYESASKGMKRIEAYQDFVTKSVLEGTDEEEGLVTLKNVNLYGITDANRISERGSTFSFKFKNISDKEAEDYFWNKFGITAVGGGHWNLAHDYYSEPSMLRVTFLHYNSLKEVNEFLRAVKWISEK